MKRSAIFKLVCALRQLTDAFDANTDTISAKRLQATEAGNAELKSLCSLGDDPDQECQQYHQLAQLAQHLVGNAILQANH